jgi:hypothetical protein
MSMSQATIEKAARASSKTMFLKCVELRHTSFTVLRIVDHTDPVQITLEANAPANPGGSVWFQGRGMVATEPDRSDEVDSIYTLRIDGTDGAIQGLIYNARQIGGPVYVTVRPISYDVLTETASDPYAALHLELQDVQINATDIVMKLGYVNSGNSAFPHLFYGPLTHPGLYTS